ncbi:hypothetical protein PHLGIDRAFT_31472, partial [Phlebiopsis gigantea 11061_1 CR5-6]
MAPTMARLRRDIPDIPPSSTTQRPVRVVACGTLFLTHTLSLASHPEPASAVRAHSVTRTRGGSASTCMSTLAQFPGVDAMLVAALGGNEEGRMIISDLEQEHVSTKYCKVWDQSGVPSAWVLHADDADTKTIIYNNPLPDITHEEFISLLGPILVPENYAYLNATPGSPPATATAAVGSIPNQPRPSLSNSSAAPARPTHSPAPLDWIHFEGRSVKTTLSNIVGLDGLARERKWRNHCVFSVDVGRKPRQGIEALLPHADVIFLNRHYARAHSPHYAASPRAFLLSLTTVAPPHALLVAYWGTEGAAVLSVPTREYFQSSGWVDTALPTPAPTPMPSTTNIPNIVPTRQGEVQSVRSGSDFWARGHHTESSSEFTAALASTADPSSPMPTRLDAAGGVDDVGAQDAFAAGMMFALSRRLVPGAPYTPAAGASRDGAEADTNRDRGRWRLEECLRFATELAGRKARRTGWDGLAEEMAQAGWLGA